MNARAALLLATLVLAPAGAGLLGAPGPLTLRLELGPGDAPYVRDFFPDYEIARGTALHWSRPEASVFMPLSLSGPAEVSLRFGPPPGGPSRVDVVLGERLLGGFECCRHRALQSRRFDVPWATAPHPAAGASPNTPTPVRIGLRVSGPDVKDRGLFLDRVDIELREGARVGLQGGARFRAAVLLIIVVLLLVLGGLSPAQASLLSSPLAVALTLALLHDPWLVHRLLARVPEALLLVAVPVAVLGRVAVRRGPESVLRAAVSLSTLAFLVRGMALNHPSFYSPDFMVHARLVAVAREAGPELLSAPYALLYTPRAEASPQGTLVRATSGLWLRRVGGVDLGLPYSLFPHLLLAPFARGLDGTVALLQTVGALLAAAAVAILCFVAARLGLSPWVGALLVVAPTPFVELCLGAVPAVFGHAAELSLLVWLLGRASGTAGTRRIAEGAVALTAAQLAYVSTLLTCTTVVLGLAVLRARRDPTLARGLCLSALIGSGLAAVLYYRDFVPAVLIALRLSLSGAPLSGTVGPVADPGLGRVDASFLAFAVALAWPALVGVRRLAEAASRDVLLAWAGAVGVFALLRVSLGGLFGFVHLALFATPLLCLAAGAGLTDLLARRRLEKVVGLVLGLLIAVLGLVLQGKALVERLDLAP